MTLRIGETTKQTQDQRWTKRVTDLLLHKTIVEVAFMSDAEMRDHCWSSRAVMFRLNTGEWVYPSQDDEGNGPGSLFTTHKQLSTIPALSAVEDQL